MYLGPRLVTISDTDNTFATAKNFIAEITQSRFPNGKYKDVVANDRNFSFRPEPKLKNIDKARPFAYEFAIRHSSYKGWNLPWEHPRHSLKFPKGSLNSVPLTLCCNAYNLTEIQELILSSALTVPKPHMAEPQMIYSDWGTEARNISYTRVTCNTYSNYHHSTGLGSSMKPPFLALCQHRDRIGAYTEMHLIDCDEIDATFLRSSKYMYDLGINVLYGQNEFFFQTPSGYAHDSPPPLIQARPPVVHDPSPIFKPGFTTEQDLLPAFAAIETQAH